MVKSRIDELNAVKTSFQPEAFKLIILGEVKAERDRLLKSRKASKPINSKILNELGEERSNLENNVKNIDEIRIIMRRSLDSCIQRNYDRLESSPAYKNHFASFSFKEMALQLTPPSQLFPISNIGSKSNYMFMHLCFYLGLHEHMISVGQMHVPQFLFIDQPSIPYYSDSLGNTDKSKLTDAFSLLNSFIDYIRDVKKGTFQIFMVEHAPKEYWLDNNLSNFHTVDEFFDGKGLIPREFYHE